MLNFLIAVITSTYERTINYQKIISFKHKAELNEECYMLMTVFTKLQEFKIIVFSTSKEATKLEDNELEDAVDNLKRYMTKETRDLTNSHKELNDNMLIVKDNQDKLEAQMRQRFASLQKLQGDI